ncbi:MAG TPA: NUDIX domain-containing protein [Candidatus Paceibacterota bacterium]|nr:NUDIX domain-containing protein [Candidatus Paceibacterota bacterium]
MSKYAFDKVALFYFIDHKMVMVRKKGHTKYINLGGKREIGETNRETLKREILEEVGLTLDLTSLQYLGTQEAEVDGYPPGTLMRSFNYAGGFEEKVRSLKDFKVQLDSEIEEVALLSLADADKTTEMGRKALELAAKHKWMR